MQRVLTCVEGLADGLRICPVGQGLKIVEGYILTSDPTTFDASTAAEFFAAGFGPVLCCYLIAAGAGAMIRLFKAEIKE